MDPLNFLTHEDLLKFFHCKKTEISCIEEPHTFLNQLRDHNLLPEKLYQKVIKMKSKKRRQDGVYEILDTLEKKRGQCVKLFWTCVFQEHILQKYPVLRFLRSSLLDGTYKEYVDLPDTEDLNCNENESVQTVEKKVKGGKRKKSVEEADEEDEQRPSSSSTPSPKKQVRKPIFSSPLKKGQKAEIWKWSIYKSTLPVTCGDKKATLYRDRLAKGIKCVLCEGQWFVPSGFEKFAGKGSHKNWKLSIRCQKTPLLKLIKEGHLTCPRMRRPCDRKRPRALFPLSSSESSSSASESIEEIEGLNENEQVEREDGREEENEEEENEEEENEEEEEESEPTDLSEFKAAVLPVICGSLTGDLYKKRFTGSRTKSIRTEKCWFTPEEFIKQEINLTNGHWKKDILCHGRTLNFLVKKKILHIHSLLCRCDQCSPEDARDLDNDDVCFICDTDGDENRELVCCDECPRAFHPDCHLPAPPNASSTDSWMCTFCVRKSNQQMWKHMSLQDALNSPVTKNIMRCEYLLLCVYKEDTQRVFTDDSVNKVPENRISNPMWLDRVKTRLQRGKYSTVGEFVGDIRLIFQNCQIWNRDNDLAMIGARMSRIFEQKFHAVFKIQYTHSCTL
ncbi:nuclear body protein SP140-like [Silurus meridionalis]|uniref:Nuclear body protein SP140-like protein n=1 Tax=Silurus meridionalis TaxID=175797 RepID=A0A8T0A6A2_SILME|nr:nuclear body protein SP140-like [Silurus meridionalis]KAF7686437.1 hypothetical protein HF521_015799 [Silurus meridionalis]